MARNDVSTDPLGRALARTVMLGTNFASGVLSSSAPVTVEMAGAPIPATVCVNPAAGDAVMVEYSCDGGASYDPWPIGAVTGRTSYTLESGVTHLRFQRAAGSGTTSTYGVC